MHATVESNQQDPTHNPPVISCPSLFGCDPMFRHARSRTWATWICSDGGWWRWDPRGPWCSISTQLDVWKAMYIFGKIDMNSLIKNDPWCARVCVYVCVCVLQHWYQWGFVFCPWSTLLAGCNGFWWQPRLLHLWGGIARFVDLSLYLNGEKNGALPSRKKTLVQTKSLGILGATPHEFLLCSAGRVYLLYIQENLFIYLSIQPEWKLDTDHVHAYSCILWHFGFRFWFAYGCVFFGCFCHPIRKSEQQWEQNQCGSCPTPVPTQQQLRNKSWLDFVHNVFAKVLEKNIIFNCAYRQTKHAAQT